MTERTESRAEAKQGQPCPHCGSWLGHGVNCPNGRRRTMTEHGIHRAVTNARSKLAAVERELQAGKCFCHENAIEHRGPCNYHLQYARWRHVVQKGEEILAAPPEEFFVLVDDYITRTQEAGRYD